MEDKFSFLKNLTEKLPHSNRSFWDHLYNTGYLLWKLGEPEYISDAGLYHSIYDTAYYKAGLNITREQVKELIGEKAENLVYIFCNLENRTDALLNRQDIPKDIHLDLLKIEYANIIEQNREPDNFKEVIDLLNQKILEIKYVRK
jgi:hypothetical protein